MTQDEVDQYYKDMYRGMQPMIPSWQRQLMQEYQQQSMTAVAVPWYKQWLHSLCTWIINHTT